MNTSIEIAKLADVPWVAQECAAWLYEQWGHRRPGASPARSTERFLARAQADELPIAFVALIGKAPIGTASLLAREDPLDTVGPWVGSVHVTPGMRRSGVASRLIATAEAEARALGFTRVWLSASISEFYRRLGYQETGGERHGEPVLTKDISLD